MTFENFAGFVTSHAVDDLMRVAKLQKGEFAVYPIVHTQAGKTGNTSPSILVKANFDLALVRVDSAKGFTTPPEYLTIIDVTGEETFVGRYRLGEMAPLIVWLKVGREYRLKASGTEYWTDAKSLDFSGFVLGKYTADSVSFTVL